MHTRRMKRLILLALLSAVPVFAAETDKPNLEALRVAAEKGEAEAQYELGNLYEFGFNFTDHKAAAYTWYTRAADQGHATAIKRRDVLKSQLGAADVERGHKMVTPPTTTAPASKP